MSTKKQSERFNCLEFKEQVQSEIYEQTKGMTRSRLSRYFEKQTASGPFAALWNQIPERSGRSTTASSKRAIS
jgi:hypothetical protein